jgi:hypothetical protein
MADPDAASKSVVQCLDERTDAKQVKQPGREHQAEATVEAL